MHKQPWCARIQNSLPKAGVRTRKARNVSCRRVRVAQQMGETGQPYREILHAETFGQPRARGVNVPARNERLVPVHLGNRESGSNAVASYALRLGCDPRSLGTHGPARPPKIGAVTQDGMHFYLKDSPTKLYAFGAAWFAMSTQPHQTSSKGSHQTEFVKSCYENYVILHSNLRPRKTLLIVSWCDCLLSRWRPRYASVRRSSDVIYAVARSSQD
jgi:hypothetical protein